MDGTSCCGCCCCVRFCSVWRSHTVLVRTVLARLLSTPELAACARAYLVREHEFGRWGTLVHGLLRTTKKTVLKIH